MQIFIQIIGLVFIYMTVAFIIGQLKKDNSVADIAWGLGFILIAYYAFFKSQIITERQILNLILVTLWGIRLATYIYLRNRGRTEDFRYANFRKSWGNQALIKGYLQVFLLQGFFMIIISIPTIFIQSFSSSGINIFDISGVLVWITGFIFEAAGDYQLLVFKKDTSNKGKIMQTGLWKYSRHPNYFGEMTQWWGIYLLATQVPFGYLTIIGPLLITVLLAFISGVPLLEKKYVGNLEFEKYKRQTSVLFPWFPKNKGANL